jgi:glycosyltransferase involved in cell wall biosynthesis
MHTPRLLFVSYHYLPWITPGSLRVASIARHLTVSGWQVTVLTAAPGADTADGIRVVSTSPLPRGRPATAHPHGYLRRRLEGLWKDVAFPDVHVRWSAALAGALTRLLDRESFDAVLSSSPPHSSQCVVAAVRRRHRFVWVADYRDPRTAPSRYPRHRLSLALHRALERRALVAADLVLANTRGNREALLRSFPTLAPERVDVLTNGFDDSMLDAPAEPRAESSDLTYVGEVYPGMLDLYLDAVTRLANDDPTATPRLAIYGNVDPREWRKVVARGLEDRVERRGFVSHEESLRAMRRARALLLLLPQRESWRTCVPSKAYPYLASGRRVLALVPEGDSAALVREAGVGEVIADADAAFAAAALARFVGAVRRDGDLATPVPPQVRAYSYAAITARLDGLLRGVVGRNHG